MIARVGAINTQGKASTHKGAANLWAFSIFCGEVLIQLTAFLANRLLAGR
jgi:hypothetical protein